MSQDIGPCKGRFTKWSFDAQGLDSIHVINVTIVWWFIEIMKHLSDLEAFHLRKDLSLVIICLESSLKVGKCKEFTFGGCEGNGNRWGQGNNGWHKISIKAGNHDWTLHRFAGSAHRRNARRSALSTTRCRFRGIRPLSRGRPFASRWDQSENGEGDRDLAPMYEFKQTMRL